MNKIYVFCYREWAIDIVRDLKVYEEEDSPFHLFVTNEAEEMAKEVQFNYEDYDTEPKKLYTYSIVDPKNIKDEITNIPNNSLLLFYGWSWMVPKEIIDKHICICLHPSPLPKYRGGSPIQNQVLAGEKNSAVTLFRMTDGLDDGPIYKQENFSLSGYLDDILQKIRRNGTYLTLSLIRDYKQNKLTFVEQNHSEATFCKRRKPEESEVFLTDSEETIYRKVRCMQPPYPKAFIRLASGEKLYLTKVSLQDNKGI